MLQFPHIPGDALNVAIGQPLLRRHAAEIPVVRSHAISDSQQEGSVAMVRGFIDLMNQRRPHAVAPRSILSVAIGADRVKGALPDQCGFAQIRRQLNLGERRTGLQNRALRGRIISTGAVVHKEG